MTSPRVSVVIPVHNGEQYLAEAIESVLEQTSPPFEVLVVDDGSTDASAALADRYRPQVRCTSQPHAGAGSARNRGIALTSGEYLAFLDADDLWAPTKLARQIAEIVSDPTIDLVFGHMRHFVSQDLDPIEAACLRCPPEAQPGYHCGAMLARRTALRRVGPFREDLRVGEFVDWIARAREHRLREAMLTGVVLSRRLHATNLSRQDMLDRRDFARVVKASLDRRRAAAGGQP